MDVVILHDPATLPYDHYEALTAAGHRVASHGTAVTGVEVFLDAMTWAPDAFLVDCRGGAARALEAAAWLARHPRWRRARLVLAHVPPPLRADAEAAAPGARFADAPADAVAALTGAA